MSTACGFVYVATGDGYRREALASAASLRAAMPAASICLITDAAPESGDLFDTVLVRDGACHSPIDKVLAIDCPYDRAVFLDTDTHVCGDLGELFSLLEHFDLALLQENHRGWDYRLPGVPAPFPEYNTGVIVFRQSDVMRQFFAAWRTTYDDLRQAQSLRNDQPAFRHALYHSTLRVATLPSEYHFLGNVPNYAMWTVHLVHARGNLPQIARMVNEELGPRAYLPAVGVMRSFLGRRAWFRSLLRTSWRMLRVLVRPPVDASLMNPGRWWKK